MELASPQVHFVSEVDPREYGWRLSRPWIKESDQIDMDQLTRMDASLNSCRIMFLSIKSSILFREMITSVTPYFMWARTSRVDSIKSIEISDYLDRTSEQDVHQMLMMAQDLNERQHQDKARYWIPCASMTEYLIGLDFRMWVGFLKALRYYQPFYFNVYGKRIISALNLNDIDEYPFRQIEFENIAHTGPAVVHDIEGITITKCLMPLPLRAQLIRHTQLRVSDNLFFLNVHEQEGKRYFTSHPTRVVTNAPTWEAITSKRRCWLAHFELWEHVLPPIVSTYEFAQSLPCYEQPCPFELDMQARLRSVGKPPEQQEDPSAPCPVFTRNSYWIGTRSMSHGDTATLKYYAQVLEDGCEDLHVAVPRGDSINSTER